MSEPRDAAPRETRSGSAAKKSARTPRTASPQQSEDTAPALVAETAAPRALESDSSEQKKEDQDVPIALETSAGGKSAKKGAAMSEHNEESTRDTGTLEDQSAKAAKKAKDAAVDAAKANDAAALAKAELVKSKAEAAFHTAQQEAKRAKDTADSDLTLTRKQRDSATDRRRHCDEASEKSRQEVVDATVHYTNLKIELERAEAKMKAAIAMAAVKSDELTAALKLEADLKAKVAELETAEQAYDLAVAAAKVTRATAESDYAQEVAKIKKAAADRHMASFAS